MKRYRVVLLSNGMHRIQYHVFLWHWTDAGCADRYDAAKLIEAARELNARYGKPTVARVIWPVVEL